VTELKEAMLPEKRGLSREEAACYVGVSTDRFDKEVAEGVMPRPAHRGRRVVWDRLQLDHAFDRLFGSGIQKKEEMSANDTEVVDQWAVMKA
jgi:hypothetical protein